MSGSSERVRFIAYIVSAVTGQTYVIDSILAFNTQKGDSGDAGTWGITIPLFNPYNSSQPPSSATTAYAGVGSPMDLVAIYACRYTVGQTNPPKLGPNGTGPFTYGQLSTVTDLYSETCVMIGMVDSIEETPVEMTDEPMPTLEIGGRDLTKIFYINDALVPTTASLASAYNVLVTNPITIVVSKTFSGTNLLLKILDLAMTKNIAAAGSPGLPAATQTAISQFGFPWRNWIDTSLLDPGYLHLEDAAYPPFQFQGGSVWANVMELRNAPTCRLFVNEFGALIFDDAYTAWTGTKNPKSNNSTAYATGLTYNGLQASDVIKFRPGISDDDLVTYLQVRPVGSLIGKQAQSTITGEGVELGFGQGIAKPAAPGGTIINTFGYRAADFASYWDVSTASADSKKALLSLLHNSLSKATLVIKGSTILSVGDRVLVPIATSRANTSSALWYVESVVQNGQFGTSFTTTLGLRFPNGGY